MDLQKWGNVVSAAAVVLILLLLGGYGLDLAWIGFSDYTYTPPENQEFQRGKTVWDWMELLIIPLVLAVGGFLFNRTERQREQQRADERARLERETTEDNQRETALQTYLDRISDLLLEKNLRTSQPNLEVRQIARVRTLTVIRRLDPDRINTLLRFLQDAELIGPKPREGVDEPDDVEIIDLRQADLSSTNFSGVSLRDLNFAGAHLEGATFIKATVRDTNLAGAHLEGATLIEATVRDTNLTSAYFTKADLRDVALWYTHVDMATFVGADLRGADIHEVHFNDAPMEGAKFDGANIAIAWFDNANLTGVTFTGAHLSDVYFNGAQVTCEQLEQCATMLYVTLPNGKRIDSREELRAAWE